MRKIYFLCCFFLLLGMEKSPSGYPIFHSHSLTDSDVTFGLSVFKNLSKNKNVFFSPFAMNSNLFTVYLGAREKTKTSMQEVFHLKISQADLPISYKKWISSLKENITPCPFYLINQVWADRTIPVLLSYNKILEKYFDMQIENVDFIDPPQNLIDEINQKIAQQSHDIFSQAVSENDVFDDTRMLLVNAIYLSGRWKYPFFLKNTQKGSFTNKDHVFFMQQTTEHLYFEAKRYQALFLPFECKDLGMMIILPKENISLEEIEKKLSSRMYFEILRKLETEMVHVKLPRFSLRFKYHFNETLKNIGMKSAFSTTADFSGINDRLDLRVSNIIHHSVIQIDEKGLNISDSRTSSTQTFSNQSLVKKFHVNHPFIFFIADYKTKQLFCIGKITQFF